MTKSELTATFKNMAPAMKKAVALTSLMALLCAGVIVVLIVPQVTKNARLTVEFAEADAAFNLLHKNISAIGNLRKTVAETEKTVAELTSSALLEPLLGSYEMRALKFVDPLAQQAGVTLIADSVRCLPQLPIRSAEQVKVGRFYARQPIEFAGKGSYAQIVAFVKVIESEMPFVSVSSLRILGQQAKPEEHIMSISLEWLVLVENKPEPKGGKAP